MCLYDVEVAPARLTSLLVSTHRQLAAMVGSRREIVTKAFTLLQRAQELSETECVGTL